MGGHGWPLVAEEGWMIRAPTRLLEKRTMWNQCPGSGRCRSLRESQAWGLGLFPGL